MPAAEVYVDTSVLIKCYVAEPQSDEVEAWLTSLEQPAISHLTVLEWHCTMRRRERMQSFASDYRLLAEETFARQLAEGQFELLATGRDAFEQARALLGDAAPVALRAMDALHLATARIGGAKTIATADRIMADAATRLGFSTRTFFN